MNLHAGSAWIGKNRFHALAFQTRHEDFTAGHRWPDLRSFRCRGLFCLSNFAHSSFEVLAGRRRIKNPTTACQPWVLSKLNLRSTSADSMVTYDHDQQAYLSNVH